MNKKAFSLIEIIISISIIIILAIVATTTSNNLKNNSNNSKVVSDLNTIENALVSYKTETNKLPNPGGNNNFFKSNGEYTHSLTSTGAFGVYGKFTENTLEKRFLDITPLDPRTNQYYSYGITKENPQFEISGVIGETDNYIAKVMGDYTAESGLYSLIKEYNGPNFVVDRGAGLPYNPTDRLLVVTDNNGKIYKSGDTIDNNTGNNLELYFSDGSVSVIENGTKLELRNLDFPKGNNLVSKVNLFLQAGSIWTKATKLDTESSFDIITTDTTASVRGTIFKVEKNDTNTKIVVVQGEVAITKKTTPASTTEEIQTINVLDNGTENPKEVTIDELIIDTTSGTTGVTELAIDPIIPTFTTTNPELVLTPIKEISIKDELIKFVDNKSCYLEDKLVKHEGTLTGYTSKIDNSCIGRVRNCNNGKLDDINQDYKYASCKIKSILPDVEETIDIEETEEAETPDEPEMPTIATCDEGFKLNSGNTSCVIDESTVKNKIKEIYNKLFDKTNDSYGVSFWYNKYKTTYNGVYIDTFEKLEKSILDNADNDDKDIAYCKNYTGSWSGFDYSKFSDIGTSNCKKTCQIGSLTGNKSYLGSRNWGDCSVSKKVSDITSTIFIGDIKIYTNNSSTKYINIKKGTETTPSNKIVINSQYISIVDLGTKICIDNDSTLCRNK